MIKMSVDLPQEGEELHTTRVTVQGWAVADKPIRHIFVDYGSSEEVEASYGFFRADVAAVFPHYPNSENSGFQALLDLYPIENPDRELLLKITVCCADGSCEVMERKVVFGLV